MMMQLVEYWIVCMKWGRARRLLRNPASAQDFAGTVARSTNAAESQSRPSREYLSIPDSEDSWIRRVVWAITRLCICKVFRDTLLDIQWGGREGSQALRVGYDPHSP